MMTQGQDRKTGKHPLDGGRRERKRWGGCREILVYCAGLGFTLMFAWYHDPFGLF
jgi:hypothetical protein